MDGGGGGVGVAEGGGGVGVGTGTGCGDPCAAPRKSLILCRLSDIIVVTSLFTHPQVRIEMSRCFTIPVTEELRQHLTTLWSHSLRIGEGLFNQDRGVGAAQHRRGELLLHRRF